MIFWRRHRKVLLFAGLLGTGGLLSFAILTDPHLTMMKNLEIFTTLYRTINAKYVDDVNPNTLMRASIDSMLRSLDPYTNYISEHEVEDFRTEHTGQYAGIGVQTRQIGKRTVITLLYENSPAAKSGLRIGDEITHIDNVLLAEHTPDEISRIIHSQVGSTVRLRLRRPGEDSPIDMVLRRSKITIKSVFYQSMADKDVGYMKLNEFSASASEEMKEALLALKKSGTKKLIIDLRDNPGGLLIEAVNICNLFLPKNKLVVRTLGKNPMSNLAYDTKLEPVDTDMPLAVLINGSSASASEIVSGALQDYDRAIILGEKSFGKGLVQVPRPLPYQAQVKITVSKYYIPSGRCIQILDYAHKNAAGRATTFSDASKREFVTAHGRKVYDIGGIVPDVPLPAPPMPAICEALVNEGYIFEYATLYTTAHPAANGAPPQLSANDYASFIQWMHASNFSYPAALAKKLEQFLKIATNEGLNVVLSAPINDLRQAMSKELDYALIRYAEQIKESIKKEVYRHSSSKSGSISHDLPSDPLLKLAIQKLSDGSFEKLLGK